MKELEGADISLVRVGYDGKPFCVRHGAMNQVSKEGFWRCISTYNWERDNACRAGCMMENYLGDVAK